MDLRAGRDAWRPLRRLQGVDLGTADGERMIGFPKPIKGTALLASRDRRATRKAHEDRA